MYSDYYTTISNVVLLVHYYRYLRSLHAPKYESRVSDVVTRTRARRVSRRPDEELGAISSAKSAAEGQEWFSGVTI